MIVKEKLEFPKGIYYEDNYFTFVFFSKVDAVIHISEKLYCRRYHEGSIITSQYSEKKFVDYIKCVKKIWKYVRTLLVEGKRESESLQHFVNDHFDTILNNYKCCTECALNLTIKSYDLLCEMVDEYFQMLDFLEFHCETAGLENLGKR